MEQIPVFTRVAAIYDVHGNLPALEAVLGQVLSAEVDLLVVGGDMVPGPMPVGALSMLREFSVPTRCIQGNGEVEVLSVLAGRPTGRVPERFRPAIDWVAGQVQGELSAWIGTWPMTTHIQVAGIGKVLFCHATPRNEMDIFTRLTPEAHLRPIFDGVGAGLVVCGHTHMPFDRQVGQTRVVNAGSVGMPFGRTGADWLLLGPDIRPQHADFDLKEAAAEVRRTEYPLAEDFAAQNVLQAPSEGEMLQFYSRVEIASPG